MGCSQLGGAGHAASPVQCVCLCAWWQANPSPSSQSTADGSGLCQMADTRKGTRREQSVTASCVAVSTLGLSSDGNVQITALARAWETPTKSDPNSPASSEKLSNQDDSLDQSHLLRLHKSGGNASLDVAELILVQGTQNGCWQTN